MTTERIVELNDVCKVFQGESAAAVSAVTAKITGGHVTGLVGPDGAGKTTLLRLIAGLLLPTRGTIRACGLDIRTQLAPLRAVVSYMPQRFGLYEDLTVAENLSLYADLRGVVGEARERATARLLQFTALGPFTARLAGKLSGGMKQKLGLACALIQTPQLLLLDEPSVGVDPISRRELWRLVYELVDQGIAVIWSTAYLDEAERCGVVLALDRGRVLYDGRPQDLTARMAGRSFLVRGATRKRHVLATAIRRADVVDGVIQGSSVRLVMNAGMVPPAAEEIAAPEAVVVATPPRFEDAFVDLLGGGPKTDSPLAQAGPAAAPVKPRGRRGLQDSDVPLVPQGRFAGRHGRSRGADQTVWLVHGGPGHHLPHWSGRDFWIAGPQWGGEIDHLQDALRIAGPHRRERPSGRLRPLSLWRAGTGTTRLHGAEVFPLW